MPPGAPGPVADRQVAPPITAEQFADWMAPLHRGEPFALAVSGGGDSMALLALAAEWRAEQGVPLLVLTVDHRLRAGSAEDADFVEGRARALGLPFRRLEWRGEKPATGVQAAARDARYRLMAEACREAGVRSLAVAHTLDDQAETVLMRFARGAGVDGLSAMAAETEISGLRLIRPLLLASRASLRAVLTERGLTWRDDPSNEDERHERVRIRRALKMLSPLGVDAAGLALTASRMGLARAALDAAAAHLAARAATFDPMGYVRLNPSELAAAPRETALRLLSAAMRWVSGAPYAPRGDDLDRALDWILSDPAQGGRTLHGCQFDALDGVVAVSREPAAVKAVLSASELTRPEGATWDGRFTCALDGFHHATSLRIAALGGCGARQVKEWGKAPEGWRRAPRAAKLTSPTLFRGEELLHAPFAGLNLKLNYPSLHTVAKPAPFALKG